MTTNIWFWILFHVGVFLAITLDLVQFKMRDRALSMRAALHRVGIWVFLSLLFNAVIWQWRGPEKALEFFTGYLIEYSLSVDNIFVFVLIFAYFQVPPRAQHRVLVWGIVGALIMRGAMIWLGVALVQRFHFVLYLFGLFLIVTAIRMFTGKYGEREFENSIVTRTCRAALPMSSNFDGENFTTRIDGRWMFTPLTLVLIAIDLMDLIFAVDSIPAVFAITQDIFIVYTSNICAILGLRSLYFLLAHMVDRFVFLKTGLAIVLAFVGAKMIVADYFPIPNVISLGVIVLILGTTVVVSMRATRDNGKIENAK